MSQCLRNELLAYLDRKKIPLRLAIDLLMEAEKKLLSKAERREKAVLRQPETR